VHILTYANPLTYELICEDDQKRERERDVRPGCSSVISLQEGLQVTVHGLSFIWTGQQSHCV